LAERVDRNAYSVSLTATALSLQQEHLINQNKEDRFLVLGLRQNGRPVFGPAAQRSAGRVIMTTLLATVFTGLTPPKIEEVVIVRGNFPPRGSDLPSLIFVFETPKIARDVRFKLLEHGRTTPALDRMFIEPVLTQATRVRIQILLAIRKCLLARDVACFVRRHDRSPSLVVTHDGREKVYGFVKACVEFKTLLTPESLRFAYAMANRDFVDRMAALFIVLTDGGQPLPTFVAPIVPDPIARPEPSGSSSSAAATPAALASKPNILLQSLALGSSRKRPNDTAPVSTPTKRAAN
jgi:hypothetical protein